MPFRFPARRSICAVHGIRKGLCRYEDNRGAAHGDESRLNLDHTARANASIDIDGLTLLRLLVRPGEALELMIGRRPIEHEGTVTCTRTPPCERRRLTPKSIGPKTLYCDNSDNIFAVESEIWFEHLDIEVAAVNWNRDRHYAALVAIATFCALLWVERDQLVADYLFADDGYWVALPLLGRIEVLPGYFVFQTALFWLAKAESLPLLRIALLVPHATAAGLLFLIVRKTQLPRLLAAMTALATLTLPVFPLQHVFVSGSHMIAGLPFAMLGILASTQLQHSQHRKNWLFATIAVISLVVAARTSPVYTITPLLVIVAVVLYCPFGGGIKFVKLLLAVSTVTITLLCLQLFAAPHTYEAFPGWVSLSTERVFANLQKARKLFSNRAITPGAMAGAIAVLVGFVLAFARRPRGVSTFDSSTLKVFALLASVSLLTFLPTTVLLFFGDRYVLVPAVFGVASLMALALPYLVHQSALLQSVSAVGLSSILVANLIAIETSQKALTKGYNQTHQWLLAVAGNGATWKNRPQVIAIVPQTNPSVFSGAEMFTSTYMQYISQRLDVKSLIGKSSEIDAWPFVEDNNGSSIGKRAGIVRSLRLHGLNKGSPIYLYQSGDDGQPRLAELVGFVRSGKLAVITSGEAFDQSKEYADLKSFCQLVEAKRAFVWPYPEPTSTASKEPIEAGVGRSNDCK